MNRLALVLSIPVLFGCAHIAEDNQTLLISAEMGHSMALDAIQQLQTRYPPAQTEFDIGQSSHKSDSFGSSLVVLLRESGYGVQEYHSISDNGSSTGITFEYSVDKPVINVIKNLYWVKLTVGKTLMTRAYTDKNNSAVPFGAWAIREQL